MRVLVFLSIQFLLCQNIYCLLSSQDVNNIFTKTYESLRKARAVKAGVGEQNYGGTKINTFNFMHGLNQFSGSSIVVNPYAQTSVEVARQVMRIEDPFSKKPKPVSGVKAPAKFCPFKTEIKCDEYTYRSFDGSCNNLKVPWWGQADTPYKRWLPADYSDSEKLNEPRKAKDGKDLPNPLDISCIVHPDIPYEVETKLTHMVMQYGQFINHDATLLAISQDDQGHDADCSNCKVNDICRPMFFTRDATCCLPRTKKPCMQFVRSSATFPDVYCSVGQREQHNIQTSFIDGSHIYGNTFEENEKLRDKTSGLGQLASQMNVNDENDEYEFLPANEADDFCIDFKPKVQPCIFAGDNRANQNPGLIGVHTMFLRQHNRVAKIFAKLNPQWEEETIFQETRRVIIAFLQHITYFEWLPIVLGPRLYDKYFLKPEFGKYFTGYDEYRDPRTANEWSAAAQRWGHSVIRSHFTRRDSEFNQTSAFSLKTIFFRVQPIYETELGGLESIMRGFLKDTLMKSDEFFSDDLTKHLFESFDSEGKPNYFDLVAMNIQRGRDHGIPGYTQWRTWTGQPPVRTWDDMKKYISTRTVDAFQYLYKSVDDVDLYSAGVAEFKEPGALVGPVFGDMIATMFQDWKFADRYWYETNAEPGRFTPRQLKEISKMTLARMMCDTLSNTPKVQPNVFLSAKLVGNDFTECENIADIDYSSWKVF